MRRPEYALGLAALLVFFALAEAFTRLLLPAPRPWNWPQALFEPSASLGFRLRANQAGFTADQPIRTNTMGLRGPERPWKRPRGVRRILVIGDSVAFGFGVAYEETFAAKLEELLNASAGRGSHEVINAGVPAFNTLQEVTYFREEGIALEPDGAVLALYWNDVSSKSGVVADAAGRLVDGTAPSNPGWHRRWAETERGYQVRNALKRSRFLYFVLDRIRSLGAAAGGATPQQIAMQTAVLTGREHPAVTAGWREIEQQVTILADLCRARHVKLVVAILPMPQLLEQRYPDAQYPATILRMCASHRLHCVDMMPAFAREFSGHDSLFIPYDGDHPNERGHLIVARQLHAALADEGTP